ncbi:BnaC06g02500D [Brassica napus]|uniref:BnaC06g02500D protein n=1 Tax=Brassica napus TaxID=3708 RepID=A0A078IDR8_BRANA|nr:BnaC06g02500D [Brassica napus]
MFLMETKNQDEALFKLFQPLHCCLDRLSGRTLAFLER